MMEVCPQSELTRVALIFNVKFSTYIFLQLDTFRFGCHIYGGLVYTLFLGGRRTLQFQSV